MMNDIQIHNEKLTKTMATGVTKYQTARYTTINTPNKDDNNNGITPKHNR